MDYTDLYYIPQDLAWFIYEIDLGARKQEKFIRAVWEKEFSFIAPQWRRAGYKVFFQSVSRYLDGCVDVEDKKKDIEYFNSLQDQKSTTFYSEDNYINDSSKLKYYYFKERRLKLLFFNAQQKSLFVVKFFLDFWAHDLNLLKQIMEFYRLSIYYYSNGVKTTADLDTLQESSNIMYFSVDDDEGIYDDFLDEEDKPNNEVVGEDNNGKNIPEEDDKPEEDDIPFDYDMLIFPGDILYFFNQLNIKQKGKNNQSQFLEALIRENFGYLSVSDPYFLSQMVYENTKRLAELNFETRMGKFNLIKFIKLYVLRMGYWMTVYTSDLLDDVKLPYSKESLKLLKKYLDYYCLGCFIDRTPIDVETLGLDQKIIVRGIEEK